MSNQRTVLVEQISYRGTDGEDHVAFRGDKVTVAAEGVEHFDISQASSPEGKWAQFLKDNAPAEKAIAKAAPASVKADEKA